MEDSGLVSLAKMMPYSNTQRVIEWLSKNMYPEENCTAWLSGSKNYASPSWFFLTNKRLIFTADKLARTLNCAESILEFDFKNIKDVRFHKKIFFALGELQIITNSGTIVLDHVIPDLAEGFIPILLKSLNKTN